MTAAPRTALLAGATGLVGSALLTSLLASPDYQRVHALVRRTSPHIEPAPRLRIHEVDFERLPEAFPAANDVFIALGTTLRSAGSEEAFRHVDLDYVVDVARAAQSRGATRLGVVSALGADVHAPIFYTRVKGEMEIAVMRLGYESVVIAQPSVLTGDRAELGQRARSGEMWAARVLRPMSRLMPPNMRPIAARAVAAALLTAVRMAQPGLTVLKSGAMQAYA